MKLSGVKKELVDVEVSKYELLEALKSIDISASEIVEVLKYKTLMSFDLNAEFIEGNNLCYWEEYYHGSPSKYVIKVLTDAELSVYNSVGNLVDYFKNGKY